MKKQYTVTVMDTPENAERAVRLLDRAFRWRYNVHGVKRIASAFNRATGELSIVVSLTADWMDSPRMQDLFPEYQIDGIRRAWYRLMARETALDNTYIGKMEEGE